MPRKILIVDDSLIDRRILVNILRSEYDILEASDGKSALEIISREHKVLSAVLLDIVMPDMDGYEVLRLIRGNIGFSDIPIIMETGFEDDESRIKALSLGANDFVLKPYNAAILRHCLQNNIALHEAAATVNLLERDRLTGIWNRESFFQRAALEIEKKPDGYYVIGCLDIEGFKVINDQYGSETGDKILKCVAEALQQSCNAHGGICGRLFSDQFVFIFPKSLLDSNFVGPKTPEDKVFELTGVSITISVGLYIIKDKNLSISAMFDRASIAKSTVKGRYDTHVAVYDESMRDQIVHEQTIVNEMNTALAERQFEVWLQPQYNYATNALIGAEALVRWRHPQKGLIPPVKFIGIFEKNGFIYSLDKYVWEEVCRLLCKWTDEGLSPIPISVNVSRYDVLRPDIIEVLTGLIKKYGLTKELLRLEVTESAFSESSQRIVEVVRELLNHGFTVEIDDFGSGYSSLNTLKDVPAQILKLDMKFLESTNDSQRGGNIVESVVRMAKWLGMSVIAEGVETIEHANYLRSIGCYYMQGYFFARPMPIGDYEEKCLGNSSEEQLLTLETVENLDNNAFWDPKSMDTLIFNSYIGGACIYEYYNGKIELLRATEKYAQVIGSAGMTVEDALKLNWAEHLDAENGERVVRDLRESIANKKEVTGEYVFLDLPNCPHETHLRSTMRVIASVGERNLVYCTNENVTAQREAERKAREAASQLQNMMDDMPGGFVRMVFAEDGKIKPVYINDGFLKLVGMSRDEIMAIYAEDSLKGVHPDDIGIVNEAVSQMTKNGVAKSTRYRLILNDGNYIWLSITGRSTKGSDGTMFLNIYYTDASEQVKEEQTLRSLLDNLPGGAGIYEFKDGQMSLTYQNKSYWELVGLHDEAFPDSAPMSAIHPDDINVIMGELMSAVEQKRDISCDIRLRHLTIGYRPVHLAGRIVYKETGSFLIYATFTPIDSNTASYVQMLPLLLSTVMETSNDYAFAKDKEFRYICCSPAFLELAGLTDVRDVIGKTDFDIFPEDMAEQFRQNDVALLESGNSIIRFDETVHSKEGAVHYCVASKQILRDSSGVVAGIYGVSRDITKERSALEQLSLVNNSIPGGISTYSYKNGSVRIVYCNDGFCTLFGGTREGLETRGDMDPIEWVYEEDREKLLESIRALAEDGRPFDVVFRVHILSGGYKWINEKAIVSERRGDTVLFNAILLDVTERQNYNEQLRISEEESSLATHLGSSIIAKFSVQDRTLTIQPETAREFSLPETMTNMPEEPVKLGLIAPDSIKAYTDFFEGIINGKKSDRATFQQRHLGAWRWMEAKSSTIFNDNGDAVKAIISFNDVTDKTERETIYKKWQQSILERKPESYTLYRCNISKNSSFDTTAGSLLTIKFKEGNFDFDDRTAEYVTQCVFEADRKRFYAFLNVDALLADYYQGNRVLKIEYRETTAQGVRWIRLTVDLVDSPLSTDVDAYLLFEDIDEAKKNEIQMKELSERDPLTGILNRNALEEKVNITLRASKPEAIHALFMIDIDSFKQVNDVFGHAAGDQVLIDTAQSVKTILRHDDFVARLGGDEFVVFLANILDKQAAETKARQICALIRRAFSLEVQISASIGITLIPADGSDFNTLYKKADAALYHVKGSGKNNFMFYNDNMEDEHLEPEPDTIGTSGEKTTGKKRRMLIVDDDVVDNKLLQNIFRDDFIIEKAKDGNSALVRLRHYGSAISVVLLDLFMPGIDGFAVVEKMQESAELRSIPVIIVSSDESREACLAAIRKGATDFITKPVDPDLLRIRVHSAVSKAENERLRAKNSLLEFLNEERVRYDAALKSTGVTFIEFDWRTGEFVYYPSVSEYLLGAYDKRPLWQILLSDMVADTVTVRAIQKLVHSVAEDKTKNIASITVKLKTPSQELHSFRVTVRRLTNEFKAVSKLIIALNDLDYEAQ